MNHTFNIGLYDVVSLGTLFVGMAFAGLLGFAKRPGKATNLLLSLALVVIVLKVGGLTPLLLPALGPLLYFYVWQLTSSNRRFRRKDALHFSLLLVGFWVPAWLVLVSVIIYLYLAHQLIEDFYYRLKPVLMDKPRFAFRGLDRALFLLGLLCLLSIFNEVFCFTIAFALIVMAAEMIVKPDSAVELTMPITDRSDAREKGRRLKEAIVANRLYEDADLTLTSLAVKLAIHPHDLSRIINVGLEKNFSDFINECRVREVASKMQDPAYDRHTLLGIAYESGFNSQRTFNRVFKEMTGKTPVEYKKSLKKELPIDKLATSPRMRSVILRSESPPIWAAATLKRNVMFKNYFKTGWRIIMRNKAYSFINVIGLALGICACIVIFLIADYEFSFDKFHPDGERIYRIVGEAQAPTGEKMFLNSPTPDMAGFQYAIPGFEAKAALHFYDGTVSIRNTDKKVTVFNGNNEMVVTEPQYFDIFKYKWLAGNEGSALSKPNQLVLTEKKARVYFGNARWDEILGRTVTYDDSLHLTVSGIVKDWNKNTDFGYSAFMSVRGIQKGILRKNITSDDWKSLSPHQTMAFVKLNKNVTAAQVNAQFEAFIKKNVKLPPGAKLTMQLQQLNDIHFTSDFHRGDDGDDFRKAYLPVLYTLIGVALFILIIAVVNFVNLSTAQSIQRAKEIGVKKVMGSSRAALILQFLIETFLLTLFAVIVAVIFVRPVLSLFHSFIPEGVKFDLFNINTIIFLTAVTVVTCLLAGFYPAKVLSSYLPVLSLKGAAVQKSTGQLSLRKTLIVFQFSISLIFIIGALVIGSQIRFMNNADKGFKMDDIITMNKWRDNSGKLQVLAQRIRQIPGVEQAILQGNAPMGFAHFDDNYLYKGKIEKKTQVSLEMGNEDFIPFYKMKLVAGRNIMHSDSAKELVINETYAKALGFAKPADAVGILLYESATKAYPVVGVVADIHENSFHQAIQPMIIEHIPDREWSIAVKLRSKGKQLSDVKNVISQIGVEWKKIYPDTPFDYSVLTESVKLLYGQEQNTATLINAAMIITIFISCMGLFGLIMFTAQLKTKEIGIRKVLGASVASITAMLSREFVGLVAISMLIASPIAWYLMDQWLQDFVYRIHLSVWIFVAAGISAICIALLTVSFQAIKAALANPVKSLRSE